MPASQSPVLKSSPSPSAVSHIHAAGENCPTCDQPIPLDRFEEIKEKIGTRQAAQATQIAARLQEQFKREKAEALEEAGREAAATLATTVAGARAEERQAADADANQKLADVERANKETQAALQTRIDQSEAAKIAAEQSGIALRAELLQTRLDHEAAIQKVKQEAEANALTIRADAVKEAEAAVQEKIAGMERTQQETETALQEKIASAEQAKGDAEAKALAAVEQAHALKETHEAQLQERVNEVRTAMQVAQTQAVNAARAEAYEEKLNLSERLEEVQRAFDKKTAEEQGEGAEINLFEALKEMFEGDKIERVGKGNAGADIIHTVMHKGMECGRIIYDSKDHNQWRYDFATKLASDKIAAEADHAILSIRKFPQGTRQLHVHEGVILANPARVVALVQVVREHIVKSHALRLSNEAKAQKSAELYAFITSAQFTDLLDRIDAQAQELQELQDTERKAHETLWKKQSIRFRSIQKAGADLSNRIDIILGTTAHAEKAVNDE